MKLSMGLVVTAVVLFVIALTIQLFAFGGVNALWLLTSLVLALALAALLSLLVAAIRAR